VLSSEFDYDYEQEHDYESSNAPLDALPGCGYKSYPPMPRDHAKPVRREIFVLTLEEKRTIAFIVIALVLGLTTKCYRDHHPVPPPKPKTSVRGIPHTTNTKDTKGRY
jgi:hypothetical protein